MSDLKKSLKIPNGQDTGQKTKRWTKN